jgi:hypothetical protein
VGQGPTRDFGKSLECGSGKHPQPQCAGFGVLKTGNMTRA